MFKHKHDIFVSNVITCPHRRTDSFDRAVMYLVSGVMASIPLVFVFWGLDTLFLPENLAFGLMFLFAGLGAAIIPNLARLHVLYPLHGRRLKEQSAYYYGGVQNFKKLLDNMTKYLALPEDEQALFPQSLIALVNNPALTAMQANLLTEKMNAIFNRINTARELTMVTPTVDIDAALEVLDDSKSGLDIRIKTYREFMS